MKKRGLAITYQLLVTIACFWVTFYSIEASQTAPKIIKVEPPFWWAGHTINPVRLLVHGENLAGATVNSTSRLLTPSQVRINSRGTYLFVSVTINPSAGPGEYPLIIENARGRATVPFRILQPLDTSTHFQGINSHDVIYLIMTDRFSDGDQSNNSPANVPAMANDRRNPRAFHGGDIRGVINHLNYFKELGVTALWLTPWYDNWNSVKTCDRPWCPTTYYHGYHAIDYYSVEDRFGDLHTLKELVEKAHALGIKIIQDQVANHIGLHHPWATDPPLENWFHGTVQNHEVERFQNSTLLTPYANKDEIRNTIDGWFSDDMPDMNQDEPEVARYEIQNSLWWIGATGIDAIRQDTIQYIPRIFIRNLSVALHRQYPKMWMVGEVFERDAAQTSFFIGGHRGWDGIDTELDSVFDFSLWALALNVFTGHAPMRALRDQLKYDALYPDPGKITTLTNNHDTPRFMSLDGATLSGAMLHTAFVLTIRGIPQLYTGEEIAMQGADDPDNRRDFPGGFPGDLHNVFDASQRTSDQQRIWQWTHDWINLRKNHSAIMDGRLIDLFYDDDVYAYARQDARETVVVALNRSNQSRAIIIKRDILGVNTALNLTSLFGTRTNEQQKDGNFVITVPPATATAYVVR
ncbi:MAG: alpha-amylase family glycosyl hydrolase [Pyrinomonadaceae bacterium]